MFREMRRKKQQRADGECAELLRTGKRGVLALIGEGGYPYALPINFVYDEGERTIYFHCAKQGHKIDAIKACDKACFTVHGNDRLDEDGWSYHVTSVVAFGRISLVEDPETTREKARALGLKYFPTEADVDEEMAHSASRVQMLALRVEHMTGKAVHEK